MSTAKVEHIQYFGRNAIVLSNGRVRAVIDDLGGMTPEFSLKRGKGAINAHWIPDFRSNSGQPWDARVHAPYWKGQVLYTLAGSFPCSPNFGADCTVDGIPLPAHGWTANERWKIASAEDLQRKAAACARFTLQSPRADMPLSYEKFDVVQRDDPAYYSVMAIRNNGSSPLAINIAHHNTVGSPFLQAGCRIYVSARTFMSAPLHTEFDDTGRLAVGAAFDSLKKAPCRSGESADLTVVPGMIGFTDFVTGAVPKNAHLGWSCIVNPVLKLAYVTFFPGPRDLPEQEISLSFNDLWMQYGGRNFTPWALHEGGADRTFCLGTENAVGAFANGLAYSRAHPELLGVPTTVTIPADDERLLFYGTALVELDDALARAAVTGIEAEDKTLVITTAKAYQRVTLDGSFSSLRALVHTLREK
jgi:hypothetical protein